MSLLKKRSTEKSTQSNQNQNNTELETQNALENAFKKLLLQLITSNKIPLSALILGVAYCGNWIYQSVIYLDSQINKTNDILIPAEDIREMERKINELMKNNK